MGEMISFAFRTISEVTIGHHYCCNGFNVLNGFRAGERRRGGAIWLWSSFSACFDGLISITHRERGRPVAIVANGEMGGLMRRSRFLGIVQGFRVK